MEESDQSVEASSDHPAIMPEKSTSEDNAQIEDENDDRNIFLVLMNMALGLMSMAVLVIVPGEPLNPYVLGIASTFYLLFDALFLYVPLINEEMKCVKVDNRVKNAALVLRSFSDLRYLVIIIARIKDGRGKSQSFQKIAKSIVVDIVSLLPIPQIVVLIFLPKMRGSISLKIMKLLNSLILLQYLARAYPLYQTCMRWNDMFSLRRSVLNKTYNRGGVILLNFIGFLLASHVLGAFWYFFSVQREVDCWGYASRRTEHERKFSTSCEENAFRNVTLIHSLCPINPSDASVFDFGIFLYALQSGMQGSTNFPEKLLQCFSWGIRNLSSFASNLNTSPYGWENLFVVMISISGLTLFMYFLGNVQTLMQVANRSQEYKLKMGAFIPRIKYLVSVYRLPTDMNSKLKPVVKEKIQKDDKFTVDTLFSILSTGVSGGKAADLANDIKRELFMDKLKKVDGQQVLKKICEYLEPVMYTDGSYILREGEPLDMMFFVSWGSILTYATSNNGGSTGSSSTIQLEKDKDDLFGEELLTWAQGPSSKLSNLPISPITVKAHTRVEIFLLKAATLRKHFNFNTDSTTLTIAVENIEEVN